jgi:hypothetical protein
MTFLEDLKSGTIHVFTETEKFVLIAFKALISSIADNGAQLLLDASRKGVSLAEDHGGTGAEKLEYALNYVIAQMKSHGLDVALNAALGCIEAAVAETKIVESNDSVSTQ